MSKEKSTFAAEEIGGSKMLPDDGSVFEIPLDSEQERGFGLRPPPSATAGQEAMGMRTPGFVIAKRFRRKTPPPSATAGTVPERLSGVSLFLYVVGASHSQKNKKLFGSVEKRVYLCNRNDTNQISMDNDEQQQLERLFGGNPNLKATLEQTCDFGRSHPAATEAQPVFRDKQSLLRHVVQRAQSLGTWIERIEDHVKEMIGNGQENDVFISLDGQYAVKLNNFALLPESATSLNGFIHRLIAHNELFPEDGYTIMGFTLNSENQPSIVLKQPFIQALRYATDEEIDDFLESHGYTVDMDDIWFDGRHEISDVKSSNVLVDLDGNFHFIDAVVNDIRYQIDKVNKISIKHPGKRST